MDQVPQFELNRTDRIESELVQRLASSSNFNDMGKMVPYFAIRPQVLDSLPSCLPLYRKGMVLSSPYGMRFHPVHRINKKHFGVDLAAKKGTPIYTTAAGKVTAAGESPGLGRFVTIAHGYGFSTLYGHMDQIDVTIGSELRAHEYIGTVGSSGVSTGPHLHYEVIKDGERWDPTPSFTIKYDTYKLLTNTVQNHGDNEK